MKKSSRPDPGAELFAADSQTSETDTPSPEAPLAVRMRPRSLDEVIGQAHILGPGKLLRRTIESDRISSIILYGPPGSGKTTLARVISRATKARFMRLNAVESSVSDLRGMIREAQKWRRSQKQRTILFIDEIHRFNRAQQDVLMPDVEEGTVILIGATTQNPSFSVNSPLLSRALVLELRPLEEAALKKILERALQDEDRGFGKLAVRMDDAAIRHLVKSAVGDARRLLNSLEVAVLTTPPQEDGTIVIDARAAEESCQRKVVYHDREGDYHYDIASAFIKSMRGSDPDASLYWLAKMLHAGEDPRFIIRRILILASEDIGNADPQALILAASGLQAVEFVGLPEARIILGHLVTYMALAPKSNASYMALEKAAEAVKNETVEEVPDHLRDAHYPGAKKMGHGVGYQYAHQYEGHFVDQAYRAGSQKFYEPTQQGFEKTLAERLAALNRRKSSPENK